MFFMLPTQYPHAPSAPCGSPFAPSHPPRSGRFHQQEDSSADPADLLSAFLGAPSTSARRRSLLARQHQLQQEALVRQQQLERQKLERQQRLQAQLEQQQQYQAELERRRRLQQQQKLQEELERRRRWEHAAAAKASLGPGLPWLEALADDYDAQHYTHDDDHLVLTPWGWVPATPHRSHRNHQDDLRRPCDAKFDQEKIMTAKTNDHSDAQAMPASPVISSPPEHSDHDAISQDNDSEPEEADIPEAIPNLVLDSAVKAAAAAAAAVTPRSIPDSRPIEATSSAQPPLAPKSLAEQELAATLIQKLYRSARALRNLEAQRVALAESEDWAAALATAPRNDSSVNDGYHPNRYPVVARCDEQLTRVLLALDNVAAHDQAWLVRMRRKVVRRVMAMADVIEAVKASINNRQTEAMDLKDDSEPQLNTAAADVDDIVNDSSSTSTKDDNSDDSIDAEGCNGTDSEHGDDNEDVNDDQMSIDWEEEARMLAGDAKRAVEEPTSANNDEMGISSQEDGQSQTSSEWSVVEHETKANSCKDTDDEHASDDWERPEACGHGISSPLLSGVANLFPDLTTLDPSSSVQQKETPRLCKRRRLVKKPHPTRRPRRLRPRSQSSTSAPPTPAAPATRRKGAATTNSSESAASSRSRYHQDPPPPLFQSTTSPLPSPSIVPTSQRSWPWLATSTTPRLRRWRCGSSTGRSPVIASTAVPAVTA